MAWARNMLTTSVRQAQRTASTLTFVQWVYRPQFIDPGQKGSLETVFSMLERKVVSSLGSLVLGLCHQGGLL